MQSASAASVAPSSDDLGPGRAARGVDELRQEGQKEQRGLGVEDVDDHALREDARERLVLARSGAPLSSSRARRRCRPSQTRYATPEPLDDREGGRRGGQDGREPERRRRRRGRGRPRSTPSTETRPAAVPPPRCGRRRRRPPGQAPAAAPARRRRRGRRWTRPAPVSSYVVSGSGRGSGRGPRSWSGAGTRLPRRRR